MSKMNQTRDMQALVFGINNNAQMLMESGTATATTATTLTSNSSTNHASNDLAGQMIVTSSANLWASGTICYGLILSNTSGTNTVVTIDQWNSLTTAGALVTVTNQTPNYVVLPAVPPFWYIALSSTDSGTATSSSDTGASIPGELTANGLGRALATTLGHAAGNTQVTISKTFTYSASSAQVVGRMAVCNSIKATTNFAYFITPFGSNATLNNVGDTLQVTDTITVG